MIPVLLILLSQEIPAACSRLICQLTLAGQSRNNAQDSFGRDGQHPHQCAARDRSCDCDQCCGPRTTSLRGSVQRLSFRDQSAAFCSTPSLTLLTDHFLRCCGSMVSESQHQAMPGHLLVGSLEYCGKGLKGLVHPSAVLFILYMLRARQAQEKLTNSTSRLSLVMFGE